MSENVRIGQESTTEEKSEVNCLTVGTRIVKVRLFVKVTLFRRWCLQRTKSEYFPAQLILRDAFVRTVRQLLLVNLSENWIRVVNKFFILKY